MKMMARFAAAICLILPPVPGKNLLLRCFGWRIAEGVRLGMSWVEVSDVRLAENSSIGYGNFIRIRSMLLSENAYIGQLNYFNGPIIVALMEHAGIGNSNQVMRASHGVTWGRAILRLGVWSKITSGHVIDCSRSVRFGKFSTLAGRGSQIWTHGYLHEPTGIGRFRIDGRVQVGDNVYIGAASVVNAGVRIGNAITVGSMSCVSGSLSAPGLYVNQPLRLVHLNYSDAFHRYPEVSVPGLVERVVNKRPSGDP